MTTCYNHPAAPATTSCADCGAAICSACIRIVAAQPYCVADYAFAFDPPDAPYPLISPTSWDGEGVQVVAYQPSVVPHRRSLFGSLGLTHVQGYFDWPMIWAILSPIALAFIVSYAQSALSEHSMLTACFGEVFSLVGLIVACSVNLNGVRHWRRSYHPRVLLVLSCLNYVSSIGGVVWLLYEITTMSLLRGISGL